MTGRRSRARDWRSTRAARRRLAARSTAASSMPRWVTKRTRPSDLQRQHAALPRARPRARERELGVDDVRRGGSAPIRRASSRARRWSSARRSTQPERDEPRRRERCPPCAPCRRRGASGGRGPRRSSSASPASSAPNGAQRPLLRLSATVSTRRGERRERHAERDRGVREPRAVEVTTCGACRRERRRRARRRAPCRRARVCVFSRQSTSRRSRPRRSRDRGQARATCRRASRPR